MKWLEVAVHTSAEGVEAVALIFEELGTGGVVIEDPALIDQYIKAGAWDYWEIPDAVLNQPQPIVKAYFPVNEHTPQKLKSLEQRLAALDLPNVPQIFHRQVDEQDWATAWQAYYKPLRVGRRWLIKPTWEDIAAGPEDIVIEMDPGMAFGSGTHATTAMCLEFLEDCIQGGETVWDVGTGTGILAIGAAKLGARQVLAVDLDEVAVKVARENVAGNGVAARVQVQQGDLLTNLNGAADIIIANIVADVIIKLAPAAYRRLNTGGYFISSGIINDRAEEVQESLKQQGFNIVSTRRQGEWVAYLWQK